MAATDIPRRNLHSKNAETRMAEAVVSAIAIPAEGQPEATAVSGIQRLAPIAEPAMGQALQENRFGAEPGASCVL